ncbi:MAG TPA: N-acetyltransferase [Cyclobacteriaceae bacterium]|nr:N-acetyltransferase [Cyclobacteriaceae bacterium]
MQVTECTSGQKKHVTVKGLERGDLKKITRREYFFDWKAARKGAEMYKLSLTEDDSILGLVALVDVPAEYRLEINLLVSSVQNVGKGKRYEGIAGCLISFACREALTKYGDLACVSLTPKTELKQHYINKYGMSPGGKQVFVEGKELLDLIKKYPS